ncbi:MAG: AAA family ATPase [Gammaproteobacteria bacterium]|nr:AAA family ATPase [Gammaproteobacteria bacterium]
MDFVGRFFDFPNQSCFVFGPRGTGKSTWLRATISNAVYLDLLSPRLYRELAAYPERLRDHFEASRNSRTVIIDEIQRVPAVLPVIHAILEESTPPRFILTGSSARKLRRNGTDLLGGRALQKYMHPFMAAELSRFHLERALLHGMLPLVVASDDPHEVLESYISLYIDEEVRAEALTRNVDAFIRFLEAMSFSHSNLLNISNVARECHVQRKVVHSYISILSDLLLSFSVPIFARRAKRATVASSKFYFFDTGVFRTMRPRGPIDRPQEIEGAALEGLVAQHLRAWCDYRFDGPSLYFWRTQAGTEIDFVVYGTNEFAALEVKNSQSIQSADVRPLQTFAFDYPEVSVVLLYRGESVMMIRNVKCIPVEHFLRCLRPDRTIREVVDASIALAK